MTFHKPDTDAFPALQMAMDAAKTGGTACPVLNAANEAAVGLFLQKKIGFYDITDSVARAMDAIPVVHGADLETILQVDAQARKIVYSHFGV